MRPKYKFVCAKSIIRSSNIWEQFSSSRKRYDRQTPSSLMTHSYPFAPLSAASILRIHHMTALTANTNPNAITNPKP